MYYTEFDWLDEEELATVLPEDGVPESLHIEDLDDEPHVSGMTKQEFQDWIWEGRHDCEVAQAMLRMWLGVLRGTGRRHLPPKLPRHAAGGRSVWVWL